jgi:hypothetical protein
MATRDTSSAPAFTKFHRVKECTERASRITKVQQRLQSSAQASKHEGATPKCTLPLPLHHLHDGKTQPCLPRMHRRHRNKILVAAQRRRHGSTSAVRHHLTRESTWCAGASCRIVGKGKSRVREQEWKADD